MDKVFFCNTGVKPRSPKSHSFDSYLDKIKKLGFEFDVLRAYSTAGDIRPPYPYQWQATTKPISGYDDVPEGLGGTPFEAIKDLCKDITLNYNLKEQ